MNAARKFAGNAMVAKIHIAKKQLGMDEDTYRDTLQRLTGHRSVADCSPEQMQTVMDYLKKVGFKPVSKLARKPIDGPAGQLLGKIEALWISGWNLGVIEDPSFPAMEAFIERQTGLPRAAWLVSPKDAAKVIDALKAWLTREGGVDWSTKGVVGNKLLPNPHVAVLVAQRICLLNMGINTVASSKDHIAIQCELGKLIRKAKKAQSC